MSLILSGTDGLSDIDGSAATPAIRGTDANTGIFFPAADTIAFSEGGAEIARFDSSGNLGIGTASPVKKLQVNGDVRLGDGGGTGAIFTDATNGLRIMLPASGTSNTEAMRIDSSGNVGIGTSSPVSTSGTYAVLHINGTSAGGQLHLTGGGSGAASTDGAAITQVGSDLFINNQEAGNTYFYDNSNLAMTINSSGNVGIGTTSPSAKLEANNATADAEVSRFEGNYTNNGTVVLTNWRRSGGAVAAAMRYNNLINDMEFGTTTSHPLAFITGNTERMRISSTGQMSTTNGAGAVALAYDARAWVNFNGTGTVAIRASGNVTSITDNGTGDYTVNFTTAMSDANYSTAGNGGSSNAIFTFISGTRNNIAQTTTAYRFETTQATGVATDYPVVCMNVFR